MENEKNEAKRKRLLRKLDKLVDYKHAERWFQNVIKIFVFCLAFGILYMISLNAGILDGGKNKQFLILTLVFMTDFIAFGIARPMNSLTRFLLFWVLLFGLFIVVFGDCLWLPQRYDVPWWIRGLMSPV